GGGGEVVGVVGRGGSRVKTGTWSPNVGSRYPGSGASSDGLATATPDSPSARAPRTCSRASEESLLPRTTVPQDSQAQAPKTTREAEIRVQPSQWRRRLTMERGDVECVMRD